MDTPRYHKRASPTHSTSPDSDTGLHDWGEKAHGCQRGVRRVSEGYQKGVRRVSEGCQKGHFKISRFQDFKISRFAWVYKGLRSGSRPGNSRPSTPADLVEESRLAPYIVIMSIYSNYGHI